MKCDDPMWLFKLILDASDINWCIKMNGKLTIKVYLLANLEENKRNG
jgi:hypothetical protein|tara:strand:+ start:114 stop:254 length:141 start_codon:yes stop_codon:yes gene_type:complete